MVDFLVVGPPRSATTYLYLYARQNDEICLSDQKEIHYFTKYYHKKEKWYHKFFDSKKPKQISGEIATQYIYKPLCPERIYEYNSSMKIVIMLRDPVERLISNYKREVQYLGETRRLIDIYEDSDRYINPGMHFTNITRYLNYFDRANIHTIVFDDFVQNEKRELENLFEFLGVESTTLESPSKINKSKKPKYIALSKIRSKILYSSYNESIITRIIKGAGRRLIDTINTESDDEVHVSSRFIRYLNDIYSKEVIRLSGLLGRDFARLWGY